VLSQAQPEGPVTLNTESVDLNLPTRHAQTDQPVTLTGPDYKIAAIGAQAWLDEQRIELQSEVTGHYESTKP
jgi:LPS export ABC transporter protein LptC